MDDYLAILIMILDSIEYAYICDILNNINQTWSITVENVEEIMEIYENLDHFSKQPENPSPCSNDHIDYINNAIINPQF